MAKLIKSGLMLIVLMMAILMMLMLSRKTSLEMEILEAQNALIF
jgi:hypothetical protein